MSLNEPQRATRRVTKLEKRVTIIVLLMLAFLAFCVFTSLKLKSDQMKTGDHTRHIMGALLTYASDYNGYYPDSVKAREGLTANAAFRETFKEGLIEDESTFGGRYSRFVPDNNIGSSPDFDQALQAGENHWMMTAGHTNATSVLIPILFENAVDATWPPRWLPPSYFAYGYSEVTSTPPPRGRCWPDGTLLVTKNDSSTASIKLVEKDGFMHLPDSLLKPEGWAPLPAMKLLDVEEK